MIQVKYASLPFGKISKEIILTTAKAVLLKLHVITGWSIPEDEFYKILVDQFSKKLVESYPTVNAEEMEYAFRNNHVKDWGKAMNLNLIDEVMAPYLEKRFELSKLEEHKKIKQIALPAAQVSDDEFIQSVRNIAILKKDYKQIPVLAYKILEPELKLTLDEKRKIFQHVHETTKQGNLQDLAKQYAVSQYFDKQ